MFIHEQNILPNVYAYVSYSETNTESILVQNNQQKMRFLFLYFFADILEFPTTSYAMLLQLRLQFIKPQYPKILF